MNNIAVNLKKKKLYGPFLWMGFSCLKARATSRRYSFYQPRENERLESTLEPHSGFEHGNPGLGIQCLNYETIAQFPHYNMK